MSDQQKVDKTRRNLVVATSAVGAAAGVGVAVPFVASMTPSEKAKAAGAPIDVDLSKIAPGDMGVFEWRGEPVWVIHRTKDMIESLKAAAPRLSDPESKSSKQPSYAKNEVRSENPEWMVMEGVCTHLGCSPKLKPAEDKAEMGADWVGGFYCPCHGSKFDLAGRVYRGSPAPTNLVVPPYTLADGKLVVGEDKENKGA